MKTAVTSDSLDFKTQTDGDEASVIHDIKQPFWIDHDYLLELGVLIISLGLFLGSEFSDNPVAFLSGNFAFNYLLAIGYSFWLLVQGKMTLFFWKKQKQKFQAHRLLLWVIWLVSCFALNREMHIFHESTNWLSASVLLSCFVCMMYAWKDLLPKPLTSALYFWLGASAVLWGYYAIYLAWLYPFSIPGLLLLGMSVHSFIPLILFISHCRILSQQWNSFRVPIISGIFVPIVFTLYFSAQWYIISYRLRYSANEIAIQRSDELPVWVILGQSIGADWITKKVIEGNLIYQMPASEFSLFPMTSNLSDEVRHDPLVFIAALIGPKTEFSPKERMKLLDVLFDARHYTQERLWSGKNLKTGNVVTQIKIYPEYRIAYTEKIIDIENHLASSLNQQEALYSFHLPEGSVVSSLSLWIHGKEEKAYLTSQTKADSAYKTIVGVESRDPSVIHWQEGNTVKVKVFPCTPEESRRFKIGITSPLKAKDGKLVYENIYFQGPASDEATETIRLDFNKTVENISLPFHSEQISGTSLTTHGRYRPDWQATFDKVPLSSDGFNFNGKSYAVSEYRERPETFSASTIYLDLNAAWAEKEFDEVCQVLKNKSVFVYDDTFVKLTASNQHSIFQKFAQKRYSIFPVHKISDPSNSLLITKGTATSPTLKDLQDDRFGLELKNKTFSGPLKTYNVDTNLSPYLKSLNEFRILRCENVGLNELKNHILKNEFPADAEADTVNQKHVLRVPNAKILISESKEPVLNGAPDHLLRLFAYNHIMQQIGTRYLDQHFMKPSALNSTLIEEASKANIVTPVSSLIVLESQADYKRFDIQKSKNSLDNAILKNSGAVPEPHEWALILLFVILAGYYTVRSYAR